MKKALIDAKLMASVVCPYCNQNAKLVGGSTIYPYRTDLYNMKFWHCKPCDAYVGCHKPSRHNNFDPTMPLGRLADRQLRKAKSEAHTTFDRIWKEGYKSRTDAYAWLASKLEISVNACHIGMFDVDMCNKVKGACADYWLR